MVNRRQQQSQRIYNSFHKSPKTMLMVSIETGILRANICRRIAELEKQNQVYRVKMGICPITKHRATFFTTNKDLADVTI